jgi:hypothetical protein
MTDLHHCEGEIYYSKWDRWFCKNALRCQHYYSKSDVSIIITRRMREGDCPLFVEIDDEPPKAA